jgi:hypothetical protein
MQVVVVVVVVVGGGVEIRNHHMGILALDEEILIQQHCP